jgi:hypothetical protein
MRVRSLASMLSPTLACALTLGLMASSCSGTTLKTASSDPKQTFCVLLVAFRVSNDSLDTDVTSGDPAKTEAAVKRLVSQANTLQQRAPADIVKDVTVASAFLGQLEGLFAKYGYDLTKLSADPAAVEQYSTLNSAAVQASLDQLRAYGDLDCGDTAASSTSVGASTRSSTPGAASTTSSTPAASDTLVP